MLPRKIKKRGKSSGARMGDGLLQQFQRAQDEMLRAQEELAAMTVTTTVGGGAVIATVTGERRVQSLTILPAVVDPEDVEMLQDLVIAAVNDALEQVDKAAAEQMEAFAGDLPISGLL